MKLLAVNGSPRRDKGNTHRILAPFLEGAKEAGAEIDLIYLQDKKIRPCLGCFNCWFQTPGECIQKDDMAQLLPLLREAEYGIFATPLYVFSMTAQMKAFFDRSIPNYEPYIKIKNNRCVHLPRGDHKTKGMVLISSCGFQELFNFDPLVENFRVLTEVGDLELAGTLLRPHAEIFPLFEGLAPDKVKPIYEAARNAGKELVEKGRVSKELADKVAEEIVPLEGFCEAANNYFDQAMEQAGIEKSGG